MAWRFKTSPLAVRRGSKKAVVLVKEYALQCMREWVGG